MAPTDNAIELVTNRLWELKRVGISPYYYWSH